MCSSDLNKAAPSKADNEYCLFGDKGTVCSYAPRVASPWDLFCLHSASPPPVGRWPFPALVTPSLPWTVSIAFTFLVDFTFMVHRAFSFYRRLGPLPPKHLGGKGYHMATKEEAGCTIKVESMDAVHGRGRRPQSWKSHRPAGRWAGAAEVGCVPR